MKFYGIQLATGTVVQDLTCEGGISFPTTNLMKGRLFYRTDSNVMYIYNGTSWQAVSVGGVTSVNGRTGAVTIQMGDISGILPIATAGTLGAVKVGAGLSVDVSGLLSATSVGGVYNLPIASASALGGIKIGAGLTIDGSGIVTASGSSTGSIPSGSRLLWAQPSAPIGWTQESSTYADDRLLRVVSAAGGTTGSGGSGGYGYGGIDSPIVMDKVPSHTHTFTGSALAAHTHTDSGHTHPSSAVAFNGFQVNFANGGAVGGTTGSSKAKISSNSAGTPAGTISANTGASNWSPKYLNLILCSKD